MRRVVERVEVMDLDLNRVIAARITIYLVKEDLYSESEVDLVPFLSFPIPPKVLDSKTQF